MLQTNDIDHDVVRYLKEHPDRATLERIISKLEDPVGDLVRRDKFFKDKIVGENGFDADTLDDPEVVIELLLEHPKLLQRPVVETPDTDLIGRPRERVPALFDV